MSEIYCPKCGTSNCRVIPVEGEDTANMLNMALVTVGTLGAVFTGGLTLLGVGIGSTLLTNHIVNDTSKKSGLPRFRCNNCQHTW